MALMLGVDTGGTYTDAVIIEDETRVVASAKSLTTRHDLAVGVGRAVETVLKTSGTKASDIVMTSLSTTLATNALVEGKGGRICLVLIGFTEKDTARQGLAEALRDDPVVYLAGGHDHTGSEKAPLDEESLRLVLQDIKGVSGFAIASQFATRNASHETRVRDVLREATGKPVSCSHELSAKLGGPKRAMTAVLNARLIGMIDHLIGASERYFQNIGINAQMMVVRGDGALISASQAREKPIETILSGPAASIVGARWLTDEKTAIVSDIGGTTTDVAMLQDGRPKIDPDGAMVGGLRTMVEAVSMRTFGLGGDSQVHLNRDGLVGSLVLGPRRVLPISLLAVDHPEMVHDALDKALSEDRAQEFSGQFVTKLEHPVDGLSARDAVVLKRLENGPKPLQDVVQTRIDIGSLDRLSERGLVLFSSVTPSDASHVLGTVSEWDSNAATKAITLFGRLRTGGGEVLGADPKVLARKIVDQLTEQTTEVILETALGEESFEGLAKDLARHELMKSGLARHTNVVRVETGLNVPIIGLGASALSYYPAVGNRLSTEAILPEHGGVANAIGAVVGQVSMKEAGKIIGVGEGAWRVFLDEGPSNFDNQEKAFEMLKKSLDSKVRAAVTKAGASDIRVRFEEVVKEATIEGRKVFVEAELTAVASGRPRIASE